ncbi:hypothetical protein [Rhodoligotrophos defluvii]|uniref:hypothetical protein n=1 Tax=Rhodoligotrophos defluvii TaxID=2561934 RepID=UPI001484C94B|nr:hypothetical protein [Rhodoligotrophos defluvii]
MTVTRQDITAVLGPVDDSFAAEIAAIDPSPGELAEAWAWVNSDEALVNDGRPLPSGKVAALVELLAAPEALEE